MHTEDVIASAVARGIDPYLDVERNHVSTGFAVDVPAILDALSEAGLAIVPVKPTAVMIEAGVEAPRPPVWTDTAENIYRAMLAAAQES